jgi:hypothetical protein
VINQSINQWLIGLNGVINQNLISDFRKPTKETPKILSDEGKAFSGKIQKMDE